MASHHFVTAKAMGYGVEIYSGSVDYIRSIVEDPSESNVPEEVMKRWMEMCDEYLEEEVTDQWVFLKKTCAALRTAKEDPPVFGKYFILNLVRHHGQMIGSTDHSSRGGEAFRDCVENFGASVFGLPGLNKPESLLEKMTYRSFGTGEPASEYPCYGYLLGAEINEMIKNRNVTKAKEIIDEEDDDSVWFKDIDDAVKKGQEKAQDILVIYT